MLIVKDPIKIELVSELASHLYGEMIKAVVDVDKRIMAIDSELHYELETLLLKEGSSQESLWGYNIYPDLFGEEDFIEFDSLINIRPRQNNRSRDVEDPTIRQKIIEITNSLIEE